LTLLLYYIKTVAINCTTKYNKPTLRVLELLTAAGELLGALVGGATQPFVPYPLPV
jgi:hypothetical protein